MHQSFKPIAGFHDDGWLETVSTTNVVDAESVELSLFLPKTEGGESKQVTAFYDNQKLASKSIARGEVTKFLFELPDEHQTGVIRFEFEYPEVVLNDFRPLGCLLIDKPIISAAKEQQQGAPIKNPVKATSASKIAHDDGKVFGFLQAVERSRLRGWVASKEKSRTVPLIDMLINGKLVKSNIPCDRPRKDVSSKYEDCAVWGFEVAIESGLLDREKNEIRVVESESQKELKGSPRSAAGNFELSLRGVVDLPKFGVMISGWAAYSPPIKPVDLIISIDGNDIGTTRAFSYRRDLDLKQVGIGGRAAFEIMVPPSYIDDKTHTVSIREAGTGSVIASRSEIQFSQNKEYRDYGEFINWSYFHREVYAPFTEADKRVLAHCDWQKQHFAKQAAKLKKLPEFSVIMPTYNRADTIGMAIESVLAQSNQNFELIIVDDGGGDETEDVVALYADDRIKYLKQESNGGVSAARNIALLTSSGEYIAYLDSDNFWDPEFLAIMGLHFLRNQEFDSAYCGQYLYRGDSPLPYAARLGPFNSSLMENRNFLDLNAFVHRRRLLEEMGGFDQELRRLVDWDLIMRYTRNKKPLFVSCIMSHYIFNNTEDSITNKEDYGLALNSLDLKNRAPAEVDVGVELQNDEEGMLLRPHFHDLAPKNRERAPVSVLIPSFNIPNILELSVRRLLVTLAESDEVIIVDNGSSAKTQRALVTLARQDQRVKVIRNRVNQGFSRAINQGAEIASSGNDLVIFNNDAIPFGSWADELSRVLHSSEEIGAVVPQQVLLPGSQTILSHMPFANPNREVDVNVSWHHRNIRDLRMDDPTHQVDLEFAPFFCVMVTRSIFDEVGGLDENLGAHYRSDRNFCNALRHTLQKRLVYVCSSKVYHLLQRSTRDLMVESKDQFDRMFVRNSLTGKLNSFTPIWDQVKD